MEGEVLDVLNFSLRLRMHQNMLLLCHEYFHQICSSRVLYFYAKAYLESGSPRQAALLIKQYEHCIQSNQELLILYAQSLLESGDYFRAELILSGFDPSVTEDCTLQRKLSAAASYISDLIKLRICLCPLLLAAIPTIGFESPPASLLAHQSDPAYLIRSLPDELRRSIPAVQAQAVHFFRISRFLPRAVRAPSARRCSCT
jgi:hypothetical protein